MQIVKSTMNNKNIWFSLFLVLFLFSCKKDETLEPLVTSDDAFMKTYGGDQDDFATSIVVENNELFVFGTTKSFLDANGDHYLLKLDLNGNVLFEKTYGGGGAEVGGKILVTKDGNFMLIGSTTSSGKGGRDVHVLKIDRSGILIWEKTFGGPLDDFPSSIIETSSSEFCIAASTSSFGKGSLDIYLIWISQNGDLIRELTFGGTDLDGSADLLEIENQEIMLYAYTRNFGAVGRDLYLMKLSSIADSLWSKRYGGAGYEESQQILRTSTGGYLMVGHTSSTDPVHNIYALEVDKNGDEIWSKEFGGTKHDGGQAVLINAEANYVFVAKSMRFDSGERNIFIVTTNTGGEVLKKEEIEETVNDLAQDIKECGEYYFLVGESNSFGNGDNDVFVVKHKR